MIKQDSLKYKKQKLKIQSVNQNLEFRVLSLINYKFILQICCRFGLFSLIQDQRYRRKH